MAERSNDFFFFFFCRLFLFAGDDTGARQGPRVGPGVGQGTYVRLPHLHHGTPPQLHGPGRPPVLLVPERSIGGWDLVDALQASEVHRAEELG